METVARAAPARAPADGAAVAPPRLRHEPALDGLRGLAVAAVVVFHLGHLRGGFLGVDLFFVLSGFLITSLLVVEHRDRGRIDLRAFWVRRFRRLLPAVLVMLAGVAVLLATLTPAGERPRFRGEALATLGYVANWQRMTADVSYWDIFNQPSPLDHTWSLAIEEQFYLVWPLVVVAVLALGARRVVGHRTANGPAMGTVIGARDSASDGPSDGDADGDAGRSGAVGRPGASDASRSVRSLGIAAALAGMVSFALLALTYSPADTNRAYFGTDTRLGPTLLGAALAALTVGRPRRPGPPSRAVELAGVVAVGVVGWSLLFVDGQAAWYYRGGLVAFVVAALVVIRAVTGGPAGPLARVVSWRPFAALGTISYGVYLWHWPVIVYVTPDRARVDGMALAVLRVGLTLVAAVVSYRLIEQPVRRGALRGRSAGVVGVATVVALALVAVVVTRGPAAEGFDPNATTNDGRAYSIFPDEADIPPDATRLLLVGDSGPIFLGPALVDAAADAASDGEDVAVAMVSQLPCSPTIVGGRTRYPSGDVAEMRVCPEERRAAWARAVERFQPDVVVYYLANAGGIGQGWLDGEWMADCDAPFDAHIEEELLADADVLSEGGATFVLATSPYVIGLIDESAARTDCRNETYRRVVARTPGSHLLDLNAFLEVETEKAGESLLRDYVHLDDRGAALVAAWMLRQLPALVEPSA